MITELVLPYSPNQDNLIQSLKHIPILSFFTGAGLLDIGFSQAGFDIIWHNEISKSFAHGFEFSMNKLVSNGNTIKIENTKSILDIDSKQIAKEAFNNLPRPSTFGIIGGPPCPDFSSAGKHRGKDGDNGKLSQTYIDRIIDLEPTFFLFENVPGLLRTEKHRLFLLELIAQLSQKYLVDIKILNALEFGVPQDRERVFLIGFLQSWLKKTHGSQFIEEWQAWSLRLTEFITNPSHSINVAPIRWFSWPYDSRYANAKTKFNWPGKSPFGGMPEQPIGIPLELTVGPMICDLEALTKLPNGLDQFIPKSKKFENTDEGDVSGKSFKRLHRWRYSPAAAYGNNEVHLHPMQSRRLTVREAMRIQSIPDAYALPPEMSLSAKFKTIGNGVPVRLAHVIALSIARFLINGIFDDTTFDLEIQKQPSPCIFV